jgi:hypothetical protein
MQQRLSGTADQEVAMTTSIRDSLTAIARQLQAQYSPTVTDPLPSELKDLVVQLVALENTERRSIERSAELGPLAIAQSGPRS